MVTVVSNWWLVTASRESLGGEGACRRIQADGYSELSTNPNGPLDFAALGHIPCLTAMEIRNPDTGHGVTVRKQDVGAGSSFLPVMGLYPGTINDLGFPADGGEFHVLIRRADGVPLHPARGKEQTSGGPAASPQPQPAAARYVNPLRGMHVTQRQRIDQGVDYDGTGFLSAIADSVVVGEPVHSGSGWEGEGWLMYKITQPGSLEGAYVYYAEGVKPEVSNGQVLRAGQRVAGLMDPMPFGIEIGFAANYGEDSYYRYHDGNYVEGTATRPGIAFSNLIKRLGGPPGIIQGPIVGQFPYYMKDGEPGSDITPSGTSGSGLVPSSQGYDLSRDVGVYTWPTGYYSADVQFQRGANNAADVVRSARHFAKRHGYIGFPQ